MNTGPEGLPHWTLRGVLEQHPEVVAVLDTVRWERVERPKSISYVFYVGGEKYTCLWVKSHGPEPS